jgi:hypothetical protein
MRKVALNLPSNLRAGAKFKGVFDIEVKDKLGNLISRSRAENLVTDEGLDALLDIMLHGDTQITTWYCVMFEDDYTPDGDETYAVPEYTEFTAYDEGTRPEYDEAASSSQSVTNSASKAVFTASDTKTLYGAALVGGGSAPTTKDNTAGGGTLLCLGVFAAAQPVVADNVVNLTYTVTAVDDA